MTIVFNAQPEAPAQRFRALRVVPAPSAGRLTCRILCSARKNTKLSSRCLHRSGIGGPLDPVGDFSEVWAAAVADDTFAVSGAGEGFYD